jgi:hypothetical protein
VTAGRLFPGRDGHPALLLAGQSGDDPPLLVRADGEGHETWRAVLPSEAEEVAMLEPEEAPRLFVVTTAGGDLLVLGDDGTLYADERFPDAPDGGRTSTYGLGAGEFRPGAWGVAVELLDRHLVYRLHPERIPAR